MQQKPTGRLLSFRFGSRNPIIAIKSYPCCGSTHPAIDAMLDLVRAHRLTPENVTHVVSWTHPRRLEHTNRPTLRSALDAK